MKRVHYADGSVLVADDLALALLEYAQALALNDKSDVVTVPVVDDSGTSGEAQFLIGPASQLLSTPEATDGPDPDSSAAVRELRSRSRDVSPSGPLNVPNANPDDEWPLKVDPSVLRSLGDDFL